MKRLRGAFLGIAFVLPALAYASVPAVPVAASAQSCSGSLGGSFSVNLVTQHGDQGNAVTISGSNFPLTANFGSGGNVYFTDAGGNQTVGVGFPSTSGSQITVSAPSGGYTGPVEVCLNGDVTGEVTSQKFAYMPRVSSISPTTDPTEGQSLTLTGKFAPGQSATVHFGGCSTTASSVSLTTAVATVPGYCPGTVSVSQTAYDGTPQTGPASSQALTIKPVISSVSASSPAFPGQPLTVFGSGFDGLTGQVSVNGTQETPSGYNDGQINLVAPDGYDQVSSVSFDTGGGTASWNGNIPLLPHLGSVNPSAAADGASITVNGVDFGSGGSLSLGGTALTVTGWGMDQVVATIPVGAVPGALTLVRQDDNQGAVNQLSFTLKPVITGMSPTSAPAGTQVYVQGSTFGPSPGSVTVGGVKASISLWSDAAIEFVVPQGASSGKVVVTTGYNQVLPGLSFTVSVPGSKPTGQTIVPCSICSSQAAGQINGFENLPSAPPPVALHLTTPIDHAKPGSSVVLTANMALGGKPLTGSGVDFTIQSQPGADGALSTPHGVTDANGNVSVTLVLSKKPGATIVIARSGTFTDTLSLLGISPTAAQAQPATIIKSSSVDPRTLLPFAIAVGVAIVLLLGAILLQLTLGRRPAPAPAPAPSPGPAGEQALEAAPKPKRERRPRAQGGPAAAHSPEPGGAGIAPVIQLHPGAEEQGLERRSAPRVSRTRGRVTKRAEGGGGSS